MRAAWLICAKDLRARLRDRSAVLIGVVVPPGLPFIFNSIFSGISRAAAAAVPVAVNDVSAHTKELDQKSFFAAGMAVFFLFFTVQFGVTSLLEERNDGTLARLLAAPISRASILGGKLLTSFLLGVISMT